MGERKEREQREKRDEQLEIEETIKEEKRETEGHAQRGNESVSDREKRKTRAMKGARKQPGDIQ